MTFPHVFSSLLFLLDKEDIWNKQQNVLFAKQGATVFVRHNLSEGENKQLFLCGVWGNNSTQGLVASRKRVWPGIGWPAGVVSKLYWSVAVADWLAFRNMVSICKSLWIDWEWFKTLSSSYLLLCLKGSQSFFLEFGVMTVFMLTSCPRLPSQAACVLMVVWNIRKYNRYESIES